MIPILLLALGLSAGQGQLVIPLSSSVYQDMDTLYLLEGLGRPSTARPWNVEEATRLLAKADSTTHRSLYEAIEQKLAVKPTVTFDKEFAIGLSATVNTELYTHSNGGRFGKESDWVRGFVDRKPLVKLELNLFMNPNFYIYSDLQYGRNRFNALDPHALYAEDIGAIVKKNEGRIVLGNEHLYSKPFLTNILPSLKATTSISRPPSARSSPSATARGALCSAGIASAGAMGSRELYHRRSHRLP